MQSIPRGFPFWFCLPLVLGSLITITGCEQKEKVLDIETPAGNIEVERTSVWIGEHCAFSRGAATELDYALISKAMDAPEVKLRTDLGLGSHTATAWGCDLTEDYVRINADYTT